MIKNKKSLKSAKTPSRRKFFKAAAATGAAAATAVAMPNVAFGAPLTLKMQAAWSKLLASLKLMEHQKLR